jgi:hypothetical protein
MEVDRAPETGFWRVSKVPSPLTPSRYTLTAAELDDPKAGNRFDAPTGGFQVLYFGSDLACAFGETLSRLRPDPWVWDQMSQADINEMSGLMEKGSVSADWRQTRTAVQAKVEPEGALFIDVEALATRKALQRMSGIAWYLATYGPQQLDVPAVRGDDRRLTRWISQAIRGLEYGDEPIAGIKYRSKVDTDWTCWAVFCDRVELREVDRKPITRELPALMYVADLFDLVIH